MTKLDQRFKFFSAAFVCLIKNNKILLIRRFNTGFEDGNYSLPAGFIDKNETATQATVRECKEETGVSIKEKDLKFIHTMFRKGRGGVWVDHFFICKKWTGKPAITEPDKCDHIAWFGLNDLPKNIIPFVKQVLKCYKNKTYYSEFGW